ncbi:MAG: hypothetical protein N0C84_05870 [Candidatus Thiodiazotropha taylori]|uniref:Uncharacterized protein n=1 Tax=Candidatus Thiodiazotropha taylori TaxID=2792791 RepID=A0A9E4KCL7_9GAMM|nr:hypothetical protein [Candidatus Thiodiazotropha taylori]MCW4255981.1 hypothetical protein [Candidatus Thiodiazotropha taylori]
MSNLDEVLNGEETTEEVTEVEAKGDEETVETPSTEHEESSTESVTTETETPAGPTVEELQSQIHGLTQTAVAERRKRQEIESKLNNSPEAKTQQEEAFWADPMGNVSSLVDKKLQENTVNVTDAVLEQVMPDYAEMRNYYLEKAQQNPTLLKTAASQPNPALYIYATGKQMKQVEEVGDIDTWRANEKAKMEQEFETKVQEGVKKALDANSELPGSAGDLRAAQSNSAQPHRELSLGEIVGSS